MNNNQTESKTHSPHFLRKRKMMLVFPILVLPFITMAFWALGGGSGSRLPSSISTSGLNVQLPDVHLKHDQSETKLSFYEQADKDSLKVKKEINSDPFFEEGAFHDSSFSRILSKSSHMAYNPMPEENYKDPNEVKVYQKLAQLNEQLNSSNGYNRSSETSSNANTSNSDHAERLDQLVQQMDKKESTEEDPEINNLNIMMEKILDIQHPERVKKRTLQKNIENSKEVFPIKKVPSVYSVSLLDTSIANQNDIHGFFGLEERVGSEEQNAIEAVVHENQTLISGEVIKLRLLSDISINGIIIPKSNFVFGTVSLNGERLQVEIKSIKAENSLYPVNLTAYDLDGLPGIYIPGGITRDVAKESLNNASRMMDISSLDASVKAHAATAGIGAVKTLLSKKTRLIRVTVKAGYKVLLQ